MFAARYRLLFPTNTSSSGFLYQGLLRREGEGCRVCEFLDWSSAAAFAPYLCAMSRRSKSIGGDAVQSGVIENRVRSGGNGGTVMGAKDRKTKSIGSDVVAAVVKEEDRFLEVQELEELISTLKPPPDILTWEDFRDRYDLQSGPNSINPHRCRKDKDISDKAMHDLGFRPEGAKGRGGYSWADVKVREIVNRIKFLHPIVYQHRPDEIPRCVTKQFAVGIVLEYEKNDVNWALYGQETNNSQRRKYEQDLTKLQHAINTNANVTKRSWRSLKVDGAMKIEPLVGGETVTPTKVSVFCYRFFLDAL